MSAVIGLWPRTRRSTQLREKCASLSGHRTVFLATYLTKHAARGTDSWEQADAGSENEPLFEIRDDAASQPVHVAEVGGGGSLAEGFSIAELYVEGRLHIGVELRAGRGRSFVFRATSLSKTSWSTPNGK